MKPLRFTCCIVFVGLMFIVGAGNVQAFHNGSVGNCDGCHNMHIFEGVTPEASNNYLLLGSDQSSTCLLCHSTRSGTGDYRFTTGYDSGPGQPPTQYTPGGDFLWLKKFYSWNIVGGLSGRSPGERHGHNIVASDFGYMADRTLITAPGGIYPSSSLHCSSCHDPHGQYGIDVTGAVVSLAQGATVKPIVASGSYGAMPTADSLVGVYRLLAGKGYQPGSLSGNYAFTDDPPYAVAPLDYNRKEEATDTRVAYGKGMSEWCRNCHKDLYNESMTANLRHPAGSTARLTPEIARNYNSYVRSGDLTGTLTTSYSSMEPYEEGTSDRVALASHAGTGNYQYGPDTNCDVMCLTCHRAHASGWDHIARWNTHVDFLTIEGRYPGVEVVGSMNAAINAEGRTQAEIQATFYGRPASVYATFQRSLCNKCHVKD